VKRRKKKNIVKGRHQRGGVNSVQEPKHPPQWLLHHTLYK